MSDHTIFGYGSLLDMESLKATAASAYDIRPAYISGFARAFDYWDPVGWTETNLDVGGQPFCAVDVHQASDLTKKVNGLIFSVSTADMERLLIREQDYKLITTPAYDFLTGKKLGNCSVFSANKYDGKFDSASPAQMRYLKVCLNGAKQYGEQFYQQFLDTTTLNGKLLSTIQEIQL